MPYIPITEAEIWQYVTITHQLDHVDLKYKEITDTWKKVICQPQAHGHFKAINYILHNLLQVIDFPAKNPDLITNVDKSDQTLFWLKEIHRLAYEPLVGHELFVGDINAPTRLQVGNYRAIPAFAITQQAPAADLVPKLLFLWIKDIATIHWDIKDKVNSPYSISADLAKKILDKTYETFLFFACVQPMGCYNHRTGRLIETALRLCWRLPMKKYTTNIEDKRKATIDLETYQNNVVPELLKKTKEI